ncbi:hypothetical protein LTR56_009880 [Elasticomyces elasticus]|nr:hypothetical protein LTR56_009880 [Elasticomyces elasticus]KAK3659196.1 hypothetical protein LTR22_008659 [Elasticomyces elasticus]KAK4923128.1 hypothetical protein LTR49_009596 [Elasticomyces elasticus]KAK5761512.1 hypothetical protein LTS12_008304 [Elasticomyces elasticus]
MVRKIAYTGISRAPVDKPLIERDRYSFGRPLKFQKPHPLDLIYSAVLPILDDYNQQCLHYLADPLQISALSAAPTLLYACDTAPVVHLLGRVNTFIKVQLKLVCDLDAGWSAGTVMVRMGERWMPLRAWLSSPAFPEQRAWPGLYKAAIELQYQQYMAKDGGLQWRNAAGEGLPTEIWRHILLFCVGEYIEPYHTTEVEECTDEEGGDEPSTKEKPLTILTGHGVERRVESPWTINPLHKQLLPVNRAFLELDKFNRATAHDVFWTSTTKRYMSERRLAEIPTQIQPRYWDCLRRMELAFTHVDFFALFHCKIKPFVWLPKAPAATVLLDLPNLRYLELFFMSTIETDYSPWKCALEGKYVDSEPTDTRIDMYRLPCQKVLVDWILRFAAGWLTKTKRLSRVELSGYIKTETKEKWEPILNSKNRDQYTGYIEDEKQAVVDLPDSEFPPRCYCPKPCGFNELDRERREEICGHGPGDSCRCHNNGPKIGNFKRTAKLYEFDRDDVFKGEEGMAWLLDLSRRDEVMRFEPNINNLYN